MCIYIYIFIYTHNMYIYIYTYVVYLYITVYKSYIVEQSGVSQHLCKVSEPLAAWPGEVEASHSVKKLLIYLETLWEIASSCIFFDY